MWEQLKRITKPNGAIVLFGAEPFSSALRMSNPKFFKYDWVWDKVTARGHLVAKKRPMAQHEIISVFAYGAHNYHPQMVKRDKPIKGKEGRRTDIMGGESIGFQKVYTHSYPKTILTFSGATGGKKIHPTQKPVALMEYLIRTYTNAGETVLDFTMGSGTTGVAAKNLARSFIGIEMDADYFAAASKRIQDAHETPTQEPLI
jgi:site-specific DNA-methyltransferase (adenine-specific)